MSTHKHQMIAEDTVGLRVGLPQQTLAAHKAQGGRHGLPVGDHQRGSITNGSCSCGIARLDVVTSLNSRGRIAICAPRFSNHRIASERPPTRRGDRRRVNAGLLPRVRLVAANSCRAIRSGCGTLSRAFQHFVRQDLYVPERHSLNASQVRWFNANRNRERHLEPCSLNQGKRLPQ